MDEEYNPFLIDFGLSIFTSEKGNEKGTEETIGETIGEKGYISPEMGKEGIDSQKCDIYSFGVWKTNLNTFIKDQAIILRILSSLNVFENGKHISETTEELPFFCFFSKEDSYLILRIAKDCLNSDPQNRPDANSILETMETSHFGLKFGLFY